MRPIDQHLKKLLGPEWKYEKIAHGRHGFTYSYTSIVEARFDTVEIWFFGYSVKCVQLPESADIEQVHEALKKLFAESFPQYTGDPGTAIPSFRIGQ